MVHPPDGSPPRPRRSRPTVRRSPAACHPIFQQCHLPNQRIVVEIIQEQVTTAEFETIVLWLRKVLGEKWPRQFTPEVFHDLVVERIIGPLHRAGHDRAALALFLVGLRTRILYVEDAEEMLRLTAHMGRADELEGAYGLYAAAIAEYYDEVAKNPFAVTLEGVPSQNLARERQASLDRWQRHRDRCLAECRRAAERLAREQERQEEETRRATLERQWEAFQQGLKQQYGLVPDWAPATLEEFEAFLTNPAGTRSEVSLGGQGGRRDTPVSRLARGSSARNEAGGRDGKVGGNGPGGSASPAVPLLRVPEGLRQVPMTVGVAGDRPPLAERWGEEGLRASRVAWSAQRIHLMREFDELLCTDALVGVIPHRHQAETARRILTRFRGRAILADEVGLGKTIEAGLVIKEYLLRGLARRVLILVPPALVSQWQGEMLEKFGLEFATTAAADAREDPAAFWGRPLVLASLGLARLEPHASRCTGQSWDLVVVDEAHHLRNAASRSHKLVKALPRKFLLLLTATPVQNQLMELFHLINLLQPGTLGTPAEFRARFVQPHKPTEPLDRDQLRALLRTVMIRNTRGFTDVRLPRRFASTIRVEPLPRERDVLHFLGKGLSPLFAAGDGRFRMSCAALLGQAGSSPLAARPALERFAARDLSMAAGLATETFTAARQALDSCLAAVRDLRHSAKDDQLVSLIRQKPGEKVLVFTRFRATLDHVAGVLARHGIGHAVFHGEMSGPERDRAVGEFRDQVPVLVATESGGEGRNLQFCRTIINYDLPWNPMRIEQRIGRLHRIGQTRDVFIFNFCLRGSLEERMLAILEGKINLFELVVGEMGMILGHLGQEADFEDLLLEAWLASPDEAERDRRFDTLAAEVTRARGDHERVKAFDEALFREEFEA